MMALCPISGLTLPKKFIDEKQSLKKIIDEWVEKALNANKYIKENYFLVFHAKFDQWDGATFTMNAPIVTFKLPPFTSNQIVFWVNPKSGICELLLLDVGTDATALNRQQPPIPQGSSAVVLVRQATHDAGRATGQ